MPDIENIRGLNLAVVKLTAVQVTKLLEDLYIAQMEEFLITCHM
jgi:hypothetical protein